MRVVFFGTPDFAVPTLEKLLSEPDYEVVGVVSQPDTRRGRGNQVSPPPVKAAAIARNSHIKIWQPDRLKKDKTVLEALEGLAGKDSMHELDPLRLVQVRRCGSGPCVGEPRAVCACSFAHALATLDVAQLIGSDAARIHDIAELL